MTNLMEDVLYSGVTSNRGIQPTNLNVTLQRGACTVIISGAHVTDLSSYVGIKRCIDRRS